MESSEKLGIEGKIVQMDESKKGRHVEGQSGCLVQSSKTPENVS